MERALARTNKKLENALKYRRHPAPNKKYKEPIVFVHFFDGSPALIKKHIDLVNEFGFDAYSYQVSFHLTKRRPLDFLPHNNRLGLKNLWTIDLLNILKKIDGPKILYSFSNPASSAIEVTSKFFKEGSKEIKAIICDSGPFVDLFKCSRNLSTHYLKIKNPLANLSSSLFMTFGLSPNHSANLHKDLASLPENFPILSIRGWKDELVPVKSIEKVFEPHKHIDLDTLILPEAGHLNGLKDFSSAYIPKVDLFLKKVATPL